MYPPRPEERYPRVSLLFLLLLLKNGLGQIGVGLDRDAVHGVAGLGLLGLADPAHDLVGIRCGADEETAWKFRYFVSIIC